MKDFPIPTHLKSILKVDESLSDIRNLDEKIVCNCGCETFKITHNNDREYNESLSYSEQDGLKINIFCSNCNKKYLLFNQAKQGYDGFVCHECKTANDNTLTALKCKKCGSDIFSVTLGIEVEDKEQFIEECVNEFPDDFTSEDFVNAFNWIVVTIKCCNCGDVDEWINLELS